jgi:hypothetical protein
MTASFVTTRIVFDDALESGTVGELLGQFFVRL